MELGKVFKMKGSYTIEAVFVVPVVLGLVFAMIYVIYYLHDRAVIYSNMQQEVISVAEGRKEYKNNTRWQQDIQKNLWIFNIISGSISKGRLYIESDIKAECSLDIPVIRYFINNKQEICIEDKYLAMHPGFIIRAKGVIPDK
ncbi:MAG: pilus assembly protein [Lachnospiraceae bacterium]